MDMTLTIGTPVYDDFPGAWFTLQSLRLSHPEVELLVIDNKGDDRLEKWMKYWVKEAKYVRATSPVGSAFPKDRVFREARGDWVICVDSHVLLVPGAVDAFIAWTALNQDCDDLLHGPMLYDNLSACTTHMNPVWRGQMFGTWAELEEVSKLPASPFEIPMHGCGLIACRRDAWLGFNPAFTGFGGEEGYIHEKYRKAGRKVLCLPFLRWVHLFESRRAYPLDLNDRIRNYIIGWRELGLSLDPIIEHFGKRVVEKLELQDAA